MWIYLQMLEDADDRAIFRAIYEKYAGLMFAVAFSILQSREEAEDAVHQAFLAILKNWNKKISPTCPKTRSWIVIITERKALDALRARSRRSGIPFDEEHMGYPFPPPGDGGLADAIAHLSARDRELILLRYDQGYSVREIARMTDQTPAAVQKAITRAKTRLRILLEEEQP